MTSASVLVTERFTQGDGSTWATYGSASSQLTVQKFATNGRNGAGVS